MASGTREPTALTLQFAIADFRDYPANASGDGGHRRSAQLVELIDAAGFQRSTLLPPAKPVGRWARSLRKPRGVWRGLMHGYGTQVTWQGGGTFDDFCEGFDAFERSYSGPKVLVCECHSRSMPLTRIASRRGWRVVSLPQNLESLVPNEHSPWSKHRRSPAWFREEIEALGASDQVYAISRHDQWLLRLNGIDADYLPYVPPKGDQERLLALRAARAGQAQDTLLILGSAYNEPTRLGLQTLLRELAPLMPTLAPLTATVAGFKTELLRGELIGPGITIAGTVSSEQLASLQLRARALLIQQVPTTGILTRIGDALTAGIPVLANVDAARGHFGTPGVTVFEQVEDIPALLQQVPAQAPIPNLAPLEFPRFIGRLRELCATHQARATTAQR